MLSPMKKLSVLAVAALVAQKTSATKLFIENDGFTALNVLLPLLAGVEIVGMSGSLGSASLVDAVGTGSDILEEYNLTSCIPLYAGAANPLLRTNDTFHLWEDLYGDFVWEGAFSGEYVDAHTWDNITYDDTAGAIALIEAVKKYKDTDPVIVYAAGTMTTVAQAISIYPNLPKEASGLYIMGGYVDTQYAGATGPSIQTDINTDINLMQDPEAAQIVLTADWNHIYIGGNVTNYVLPSQELYDRIISKAGDMSVINNTEYFTALQKIVYSGTYSFNNEQETLPFWDEVVSAYSVFQDMILSTTDVAAAVDTSFNSPFYGNLRIWSHDLAPRQGYRNGNVTIVDSINSTMFFDYLMEALFLDWTQYCATGKPTALDLSQL